MKKYQAIICFEMDDEFMKLIPEHRDYINYLINQNIIESYAVSMESHRSWITINAESKKKVKRLLTKSPLHKYWVYDIEELYLYDGQLYRFPLLQFN